MGSGSPLKTVDDFLGHRGSSGGGANFLSAAWRKSPGYIDVWMHTEIIPIPVWIHGAPSRLRVYTDKKTNKVHTDVWGGQWTCHESEDVLKVQNKFDDGKRIMIPRRCSLCRLVMFVSELVEDGKLEMTKPLFRFEGDDPNKAQIFHAGGLVGLFGSDNLSEAEVEAMKKAGISPSEAWNESAKAKLNYVFSVVEHANTSRGCQVTMQTGLLGQKVQAAIEHTRMSAGSEEGDPFTHPYAIRWLYKPTEKEFSKKYDALRMEKLKLTKEIDKLIRGTPPDTSIFTKKFDQKTMRTFLEAHCLAKKEIPWDAIFDLDTSEPAPEDENDSFDYGANAKDDDGPTPEVSTSNGADETPPVDPERAAKVLAALEANPEDESIMQCADDDGHGCGKPLFESDHTCPHCGYVWDQAKKDAEAKAKAEASKPAEEPKTKTRKRGAKAAADAPAEAPKEASKGKGDKLPWGK
ncbi:MAG: hypothetical protein PVSMB8_08340 [Vulcanimicrobiaceae bacterium]